MNPILRPFIIAALLAFAALPGCESPRHDSQPPQRNPGSRPPASKPSIDIRATYSKREELIPMRDGVRLFTSIYEPRDGSRDYPIMMLRTPYSVAPYGKDEFRDNLGPSHHFAEQGFIFVYQDVRGRMMSEGDFVNMRPHIDAKHGPKDIDESSDTFDTIDWLIKNVPHNNGRVGMWGISYPGFYAAAGMIDSHPALKAVSPQAPIADWFAGDDFHHNGAFFLMDALHFFYSFGRPRPQPTQKWHDGLDYHTPDAYAWYLNLGPLPNANANYLKHDVPFWDEMMAHGANDEYWKARNLLPHLNNIHAAVMTVGGLFDAEDLYGPLHIYAAAERANPGTQNTLVLGPWSHGGWSRTDGDALGDVQFGSKTAITYQNEIELPFFNHYLKGTGNAPPEAKIFCTGENTWKSFGHWPPPGLKTRSLFLQGSGGLSFDKPSDANGHDEYISDPMHPVPYTNDVTPERGRTYMSEDQRFAARRPDVLTYQTEPLKNDLTVMGPITASFFISTTGTDADFVVKVIDVYPNDAKDNDPNPRGIHMGGYQALVRAEIMRAKFRDSLDKPKPLTPDETTPIKFELRDVCHTFKPGHRVMVQIQSSWFPLVDRNPQTFCDIYNAAPTDFKVATHRVFRSPSHASSIEFGVK